MNDLKGIDLNLLVALDALLRERHVTRAARSVGLSQPAMSNALARLRILLDDPVLVRAGRQMRPTPRALALEPVLSRALATIQDAIWPDQGFDAAGSERCFRLVADDYVGFVLLPVLCALIRERAPGVSVEVLPRAGNVRAELLRSGQADAALGYFAGGESTLRTEPLFEERFAVVMRAGHPALVEPLDLARYAALCHVLVAPQGGQRGVVDRALAAHGLTRRVVIRVPHFLVAPSIVARTDCVLTLAHRVAQELAAPLDLQVLRPPVGLAPFGIALRWHGRHQADGGHRWLRECIREAAACLAPGPVDDSA